MAEPRDTGEKQAPLTSGLESMLSGLSWRTVALAAIVLGIALLVIALLVAMS